MGGHTYVKESEKKYNWQGMCQRREMCLMRLESEWVGLDPYFLKDLTKMEFFVNCEKGVREENNWLFLKLLLKT